MNLPFITQKYLALIVSGIFINPMNLIATERPKSQRNSLEIASSSLTKKEHNSFNPLIQEAISSFKRTESIQKIIHEGLQKIADDGPLLNKLKTLEETHKIHLKPYSLHDFDIKQNIKLKAANDFASSRGPSTVNNLREHWVLKNQLLEEQQMNDFVYIQDPSKINLWTPEKIAELEKYPFGKFFAAHILEKATPTSNNDEVLLNALAQIPVDMSLTHDFSNLQKKVMHRSRSIDLADIDDSDWIIMDDQLAPKFQEYAWKSKMINSEKKENGVMVFFLFHGTFVDYTEFGKDNDTQLTKDLINDAKILAYENDCAVKVISFNWSGELSAPSRKEAATVLKHYFLNDTDCMQAKQITAFSHSFGGDVLLQFADQLRPHQKTLDWAVMAGTPLGEATRFNPIDKKARILEPSEDEQCFNIKLIIQCFSRGDITQAAGSRQMTCSFINPLGIAERRLPLLINKDRKVVNCHFEHEGELCSHVNIKWHVAASLPYLIPTILSLYPHAHDLSIATGKHNLIATLRNPIFSQGYETTFERSTHASIMGEQMFKTNYGKTIGKSNTWTILKALQELKHAGLSQETQGREESERLDKIFNAQSQKSQ